MNKKYLKLFSALLLITSLIVAGSAFAAGKGKSEPLIIREQGSFAVGGTVIKNPGSFDPIKVTPDGQTLHGDHASVSYQFPANARKLPLVFLHGAGQSSRTWETTPDGREGFKNIFLQRGYGTYLIDQPRRGQAGRSTVPATDTSLMNRFSLIVYNIRQSNPTIIRAETSCLYDVINGD